MSAAMTAFFRAISSVVDLISSSAITRLFLNVFTLFYAPLLTRTKKQKCGAYPGTANVFTLQLEVAGMLLRLTVELVDLVGGLLQAR